MHRTRIDTLEGDVYNFIFQMLDDEPELSGLDAGMIATRTARKFTELLLSSVENVEVKQ